MKIYREAGGTNAVLANVAIDIANRPQSAALEEVPKSLVCPPDEARKRLKRLEQIGFDEILLVSHSSVLEDIERARDFLWGLHRRGGGKSSRHDRPPRRRSASPPRRSMAETRRYRTRCRNCR